jgi:sensor domain CHASE-containing protein
MHGTNEINGTGDAMRKIFILYALVFALVTAATATVMATTSQSQASLSDTAR